MIESLKTVTRGLCDIFSCDVGNYGLAEFENERIGIKFRIPRDCSIERNNDTNGRFYEVISSYSDEFLIGVIECLEEVSLQKTVQNRIDQIKKLENYNSFETVTRRLTEYAKAGYSEYKEEIAYNVVNQPFRQKFSARTIPSLPNTIYLFTQCYMDIPNKNRKQKNHFRKRREMGRKMYKSFKIDIKEKWKGKVTLVNDTMKINLPHPCFKTKKKIDGFVCHFNEKVIDVSKFSEEEEETEGEKIEITEKKKKKKEEEESEEETEAEAEAETEKKSEVEEEKQPKVSEKKIDEESKEEEDKKEKIKEEIKEEETPKKETLYEEEINVLKKKLIINEELNQLLLKGSDGSDIARIQTFGFEAKKFAKNIKILNEKEASLRSGKSTFCIYRYGDENVNLKLIYPYYMFVQKEFFTRDNDPLVVIKSERSMLTKISIRQFDYPLTQTFGSTNSNGSNQSDNTSDTSDTSGVIPLGNGDDILLNEFYLKNIAVEHGMFDWVERVHSIPMFELQKRLPEEKRRYKFVFRYRAVVGDTSNMVTFLVLKDLMTVIRIHSMNQDNGEFVPNVFSVFKSIHSMVDCSFSTLRE